MKKRTKAAIILGTLLLCAAAYAAGSYAKEKLIEEAVEEAQRKQEAGQQAQDPQPGYILIHTTDGEAWGFYGDIKIISDGKDGGDIDIDMIGWLVGSTHDCYNPDPEE